MNTSLQKQIDTLEKDLNESKNTNIRLKEKVNLIL
jgi:hypothetical protein